MIQRQGNYAPLAPRRYAPDHCAQRRASNKSWYSALTRGLLEPFTLGRENFQFARIFAPL